MTICLMTGVSKNKVTVTTWALLHWNNEICWLINDLFYKVPSKVEVHWEIAHIHTR